MELYQGLDQLICKSIKGLNHLLVKDIDLNIQSIKLELKDKLFYLYVFSILNFKNVYFKLYYAKLLYY